MSTTYLIYNSTVPTIFVYLLTTIETLYQTSVPLEVQNRKNVHLATSDCLVIECYLCDVLHFTETIKAKHQLPHRILPNFLESSRFVRRLDTHIHSTEVTRLALSSPKVQRINAILL